MNRPVSEARPWQLTAFQRRAASKHWRRILPVGFCLASALARPAAGQQAVDVNAPARGAGSPGSGLGLDALGQAEASAYCRHVQNSADSTSALLSSPRVFSSFGLLHGTPLDPEGLATGDGDLVLNFRAGVEVSPTRMYTGTLLRQQAAAECERHRAELALEALSLEPEDERRALAAKAEVLRGAMSVAEGILADSQAKLASSRTTLQAHAATRLRVEAHKRLLSDIDAQLARLPNPASRQTEPKQVFDALRHWESRREAADASLRRLESVEVGLRGGYNELFSVPQSLPIFASVNVGFAPGWFWQKQAEEQSAQARRDWVEAKIERARAALRDSSERLARQLQVAQRQLQEVSASLADLELRYTELQAVKTSLAQDVMEYLWFELVRLRAERAYAQTEVQSLEAQKQRLDNSLR
jgi:hypothetical protein